MKKFKRNLERIFIVLLIALILFLFLYSYPEKNLKNKKNDFRVYTSAICKENENNILCKDKIIVNCRGIEYTVPELNLGSLNHWKGWKDPRTEEE